MIVSFACTVAAGVVSIVIGHCICRWIDRHCDSDKH